MCWFWAFISEEESSGFQAFWGVLQCGHVFVIVQKQNVKWLNFLGNALQIICQTTKGKSCLTAGLGKLVYTHLLFNWAAGFHLFSICLLPSDNAPQSTWHSSVWTEAFIQSMVRLILWEITLLTLTVSARLSRPRPSVFLPNTVSCRISLIFYSFCSLTPKEQG